jgi:hypothetical protein
MFAGDKALSATTVFVVGLASTVRYFSPLPPLAAGLVLLVGCLIVIVWRTQTYRTK